MVLFCFTNLVPINNFSETNKEAIIIYRHFFIFLLLMLSTAGTASAVQPSSINISVEASAIGIAAIVNQSLPKVLYKGQGSLGTSVTVLRTGPILVTATDNYVFLTLPVQLTFGYAMYESYPLRTNLKFKTKVNVTPDWCLKTDLYYTGLSDNFVDTFKLGPLTLKPKSTVENAVGPIQKLLAPYIDKKINESVQLRAKIIPVWNNAFYPILVTKDFRTWLKLTPEKIVMSPLVAANNQIRLSIGFITGAEVTVGPKPAAAPVKKLPPVQLLPVFDKNFNIQLATDIFYVDLMDALKPVLIDKTFGDDKKITIKSFNLSGKDDRLAVVLAATGDFDGELTLFAKPVYHPQKNLITFENVDFDTKNAGWLITAGSWLLGSSIRSTIKTKLDSSIIDQLEKARLKASSALSSLQVNEHVKLIGAVKSLFLGESNVLNDRLSVHVIARGESSVILK
ncbi:MAG: DUF4403 family protein [Smithella sp.]